jgi:ferritin-like metal-binding protein YciE
MEKVSHDIHVNEDRFRKQLSEIYSMMRQTMRDLASHRSEADLIAGNMKNAAANYLQ